MAIAGGSDVVGAEHPTMTRAAMTAGTLLLISRPGSEVNASMHPSGHALIVALVPALPLQSDRSPAGDLRSDALPPDNRLGFVARGGGAIAVHSLNGPARAPATALRAHSMNTAGRPRARRVSLTPRRHTRSPKSIQPFRFTNSTPVRGLWTLARRFEAAPCHGLVELIAGPCEVAVAAAQRTELPTIVARPSHALVRRDGRKLGLFTAVIPMTTP